MGCKAISDGSNEGARTPSPMKSKILCWNMEKNTERSIIQQIIMQFRY